VGQVPLHHAAQPLPLLRDGLMSATLELVLDLRQLRPHPLRDGDTPQPEPPVLRLSADVRKAEEVERFRLTSTPRRPVSGLPPDLDQPGLIGVQPQTELRDPLAKLAPDPPRILLMLEPDDKVVGEPHNDHVTVRPPLPPPASP